MLSSADRAIQSSHRRPEGAPGRQSASCASHTRSTPYPRAPGALGGGAQGSPMPSLASRRHAASYRCRARWTSSPPRHRRPTTQNLRRLSVGAWRGDYSRVLGEVLGVMSERHPLVSTGLPLLSMTIGGGILPSRTDLMAINIALLSSS
jgi:hypothetical protein